MGDGFTYIINDGYAMLTGIYDTAHFKNQNKKSKFKLPEKADGYPVIAVAHDFPWHQIGRNVVVVPEGYRALGRSALQGTDEIPIFTLEFPATLSIIEPGFFKQIYKLKLNSDNPYFKLANDMLIDRLTGTLVAEFGVSPGSLPASVTTVGESTFSMQSGKSVTLPDTMRHIEDNAFMWLQGKNMKIIIPEGVLSIGKHCFGFVDGTLTVHIPASVNSIHEKAFTENSKGALTLVVKKGSYAHEFVKNRSDLVFKVE